MSRRYLNLVLHDSQSCIFSVCRIDLCKHLFYRNSEIARAAGEKKAKRGVVVDGWKELPPAAINFQPMPGTLDSRMFRLFSLLGDESNILYVDPRCKTALYNFDTRFVQSIPSPNSHKEWDAVSFPRTIDPMTKRQSLYVLDLSPHFCRPDEINRCFEVLWYRKNQWRWDLLPPPPFFLRDPNDAPRLYSYAVVHPSTLCISSMEKEGFGTYTFDTVRRRWRQAADWALPFFGKAEYVPELSFWFGLSACNPSSGLCALDLTAMDPAHPPVPQHTLQYLDLPQDAVWKPSQVHLVNLGSGRFCVATIFGTLLRNLPYPSDHRYYSSDYEWSSDEDTEGKEYAVFTGLEVKRSDDGDGSLQLIKHMSKGYTVGCRNIECVL